MTSKSPSGSGKRGGYRRPKKRAQPAKDTKGIGIRRAERIKRQAALAEYAGFKVTIEVLMDEIKCLKRALFPNGLPQEYYGSEEEE